MAASCKKQSNFPGAFISFVFWINVSYAHFWTEKKKRRKKKKMMMKKKKRKQKEQKEMQDMIVIGGKKGQIP